MAMDPAVLRLREGARLNRAVNALAGVIRALATQRREFAGHGGSALTKVLAEPLGGNCATTVLATLRPGEWERSAAVMDLVGHARRAPTFPVVCDDAARGLQQRLRSRLLQINEERETYREQIQSQPADGIDPDNVGLQLAKLHELEGRLVEERGDKAELLGEKEALLAGEDAPVLVHNFVVIIKLFFFFWGGKIGDLFTGKLLFRIKRS